MPQNVAGHTALQSFFPLLLAAMPPLARWLPAPGRPVLWIEGQVPLPPLASTGSYLPSGRHGRLG